MPLMLLSLVLLAVTGLVLWLVKPHRSPLFGWLAAIPPLLVTIWLITQLPAVGAGTYLFESYPWAPQVGLELSFRLDGLALFFGLIVAGIGSGVALYTAYYFEGDERQGFFYLLLFAFMASMLGLVWADDMLALFVFWEGTSITSYVLIAFKYYDKGAKEGGRRAFIVTGLGGLAMLAGIVLLGWDMGTYSISELVAMPGLTQSPVFPAALALILMGAFTKSAQFPFHFWLPGAMAAPTPASAYLHSATMVKAGVYLLARLHPGMSESPLWFWSLFICGGITMVLGAVSAIRYYDMKALLANATLSQLGILVMLLAFNTEAAYVAVVVGTLAHALYKGPLFLVAGIVDHATGTRDLRRLAGLLRAMPLVGITALLAGLSMAGIPPTFGFVAKEYLLETYYHFFEHDSALIGGIALAAALVTGAFFVAYSFTLLWEAFLRRESTSKTAAQVHHAPAFGFVLPPLALTLIGTAIPFAFPLVDKTLFVPTAASIAGAPLDFYVKLWHGITPVFLMSMGAIVTGTLLFLVRGQLRAMLRRTPRWLNGVYLFNKVNDGVYGLANWVTRNVQGGTMSTQASIIFLAAFTVVAYSTWLGVQGASFGVNWAAAPLLPEAITAVLAVVAAFTTLRARTRLGAIISLGVVGVTVTLLFIFYSAPDLALTQLLIEVLSLVLLVLVFFRVKPDLLPPMPRLRNMRTILISMAMGFVGFALVVLSDAVQVDKTISDYFLYYGVPEGHGANIVNVILVDFRGYDTLGEITVLGIAAVGGFALLRAPRVRALRARLAARRGNPVAGQIQGE